MTRFVVHMVLPYHPRSNIALRGTLHSCVNHHAWMWQTIRHMTIGQDVLLQPSSQLSGILEHSGYFMVTTGGRFLRMSPRKTITHVLACVVLKT